MEFSDTPEGRVFTAARLNSQDAATRLTHLADGYKDVNQLVLERLELDRRAMRALKLCLESECHSWISLKLVDCRVDPNEDDEIVSQLIQGLQFPPRLFLQSTRAFPSDFSPFFPLECIDRNVKSLRICTNAWTHDMRRRLKDAISRTKTLEELCLSGSRRRGAAYMDHLVEGLQANTSIQVLDLGDSQLDDTRAAAVITALKGHTNLRKLDLSNNQFGDGALEALATELLLPQTTNLQILDLSLQRNRMNLTVLAPALATNQKLKKLFLQNSRLIDQDVKALTDALCQNTSLRELNLSDNLQVTDAGLIYLASKLPEMSLSHLNIRKTQPPSGSLAVMKALREGMQENTKLLLLRSCFWKIVQHGRHVQYFVNANRGGRRALEENLNPALWPLVFQRANEMMYYCPVAQNAKVDAVYHLFRNAPVLWE
jgi:Ran GTPase-activating protein (RanGAP) involved in mRNA processing and transport